MVSGLATNTCRLRAWTSTRQTVTLSKLAGGDSSGTRAADRACPVPRHPGHVDLRPHSCESRGNLRFGCRLGAEHDLH